MDETIHQLKKEELMVLKDASVVIRKPDGKIKVKQATHLVGAGMVGGAFWGILIGMFALFLLIEKWTEEKVLERLKKFNATIIRTSLTKEEEEKLKVAFVAGE
jgi:uncharacterized membrane protein